MGPAESFAAGRREQAWRDTLTAAGARVPPPLRGDWSAQSGYQAGLRLAASQPGRGAQSHAQARGGADNADESDCTAVFVANDQVALGVLRALHEQGIDVPGRMSVVGFDDIDDAASFIPPLTTVHQDFAEVGRACVQAVLDQIAAGPGDDPTGTTLVPTRLVVRASTAPPPGGPPGARH